MIVVDESIENVLLIKSIAAWYPGQVLSIRALRRNTLIQDEAISMLLRQAVKPTFVTINVTDFWKRMRAEPHCCIIALELTQGEAPNLSNLLRRVLSLAAFRTKAARMGKVIRVMPTYIEYYALDRQVRTIAWTD